MPSKWSPRSQLPAALAALLAIAVLAGCGSAQGTSNAGTSTQDLASFQKVVDDASVAPTEWNGPTEAPTPPKNIKLAVIICASVVSGCVRQGQGMQEAGEALGWEVTVYDGKGDPVAQNNAMSQAINSGANAVLLAATDPVPLSASVELAKSKGIPVGTTGLGTAPDTGGAAFDVGPDYSRWGTVLGSWIVVDSKGQANFLPAVDMEFANSTSISDAMIQTVGQCTGCQTNETQQFVVSDIGNGLGPRIASELQRNPNINYLSGAYDSAAADMVTSIVNAGIGDRVSLVSCVGSPQNFQFVKDGNVQKVDMVQDDVYMGYAAVDQIIRLLAGEELWKTPGVTDPRAQYGEGSPDQLLTQSNIGDPSLDWVADFDYQTKFKTLWGVS